MTKTKILILADLLFIVLIGLIPLLWFPSGYMVTGHDAAYPIDIIGYFQNRFFTWNNVSPFGMDFSHAMGSLTIHGIEAFFRYVGFSLYNAQKLNFIFWFIAMGLAMYYFAYNLKNIVKFRYFPLLASIFYIFNFYLLALWRMGAGTTFAAYTALPLVASFFIRALLNEYSPLKSGIMISLILFIFNAGGGFSVPLYGGLLITIFTALFYFSFIRFKEEGLKTITTFLILFFAFLIPFFFLNAYWVLPFIAYVFSNFSISLGAQGGVAGVKHWTDSVSISTSMINLFRLQGIPDWYDNAKHAYSGYYLSNPILITASFIFAPLSYLSLLLPKSKEQKRLILFFVFLSLIALFFSAGTHPPTGLLFGFFMDVVPGFVIFRSAQYKFIPALYFSFAILLSYTINYLLENMNLNKFKMFNNGNFKKSIIAGILIFFVLLYHFPFFGRGFFVWNAPLTLLLKIPDNVFQYMNWSKSNLDDEHRLLILPRLNSVWRAEVYKWNYFSLLGLFNLLNPKPFVENSQELGVVQYALTNRLYDEIVNNGPLIGDISSLLQTPNWLLRGDSYFDLNWIPSENPKIYDEALAKNFNLTQIWRNGEWKIYHLNNYKDLGKIYGLKSLTEFVGAEKDIVAPILNKSNNFIQSDIDNKNLTFAKILPLLPIKNKIYSSACSSCILEQNVTMPEVLPVRILPGSLFYFLKEQKEKPLELISDKKQLMINNLGLSLTRTTEIKNMLELQKKTEVILPTINKLYNYWKNINDYLTTTAGIETDFSLLTTIKSYTIYEKSELQKKYYEEVLLNNEELISNFAPILDSLEKVLVFINREIYSQDWSMVKKYKIPNEVIGKTEIFLDKISLNIKNDNSVQLPTAIILNDKQIPLKAIADGEKISLGTYDLQNNKNIGLIFPESDNLLTDIHSDIGYYPKLDTQCLIAKVNNFSWQKKYKIKLDFFHPAPKDTQLYVRIEKNFAEKNNSENSSNKFSKPDYIFTLSNTRENPSQYFIFDGRDGDTGATVYFCSSEEDPSNLTKNFKVESLYTPTLFFVNGEEKQFNSSLQNIIYKRINQTKYQVVLPEHFSPAVIVFNENFNMRWKLYVSRPTIGKGLLPSFVDTWFKPSVFEQNHFKIYGFANAWYIDKPVNGKLILEFYPQQLFYKGVIVTSSTLTLILFIYLFFKLKRKK